MTARSFSYDSLSRLTSAFNPESGTLGYTYDAIGNLSTRKDARSITTTYTYDALNRNTQKSYSDGTPTATFVYDTPIYGIPSTNPIGRIVEHAAACAITYPYYDSMGRTTQEIVQSRTPSTF
jgi:YD repeat-containing protein